MPRPALTLLALCTALVGCSSSTSTPQAQTPRSPSASTSASSSAAPASRPHRLRAVTAPWSLPAPRSREVVLATAHGLVVAGGLDAAKTTTSTVWLVDPASGRLRSTGRLATAVHDATGVVLGGVPYVVAGGNQSTYDDVQQVDPSGMSRVVGHLPRRRSDLVSTTVGASAFVLGGFDGATSLTEVLRTTDGRRFTTVARLATAVRYGAVVAAGNGLFVFGGEHNGVGTDVVQLVDLAHGRTTVVGRLPHALSHESAFVLDGAVWLVGGRSNGVLQSRILRCAPPSMRCVDAGHLPYAVADAGLAVVGSTVYLVGGETPNPTARVVTLVSGNG